MTERLPGYAAETADLDVASLLEGEQMQAQQQLLQAVPPFVLASASPRRRELLAALGLRFDVDPADVPEVPQAGESPAEFVVRAAREKAAYVLRRHSDRAVLGADTVVAIDNSILGKPRDRGDAKAMLRALAARTHRVCTGIALLTVGASAACVVMTEVTFKALADAEIEAYLDTGEPFDKAGAYGIQGRGSRLVSAVAGSYSNVVGLPLVETAAMLGRGCRDT